MEAARWDEIKKAVANGKLGYDDKTPPYYCKIIDELMDCTIIDELMVEVLTLRKQREQLEKEGIELQDRCKFLEKQCLQLCCTITQIKG